MNSKDIKLDGMRGLFISAFLNEPADVGHRKRVDATIRAFQSKGCSVTFLHFCAELPHLYGEHESYIFQARSKVDDLITYYPRNNIFSKPTNVEFHKLDEWIEPEFITFLSRLTRKKHYDFVLINNVWMSKCFDALPPGVLRINETHDVFCDRRIAFQAIGEEPDFFTCTENDEAFGLRRSDINIAITDDENRRIKYLAPNKKSIHLPYYENETMESDRTDYLHGEKITFGFMGSSHPFNIHGLRLLIKAFKRVAAWSPIELIVAGNVVGALNDEERRLIKSLGYVNDVSDFYNAVDIVVSPLDYGSGLKIKVVEAISFGIPIISTRHSASGTDLMGDLIVADVEQLAGRMSEIGIERPSYAKLKKLTNLSRRSLQIRYQRNLNNLAYEISHKTPDVIIDTLDLLLETTDPRLWARLSLIRELCYRGPVWIRVPKGVKVPSWFYKLPANVRFAVDDLADISNLPRFSCLLSRLQQTNRNIIYLHDYRIERSSSIRKYVVDARLAEGSDESAIQLAGLETKSELEVFGSIQGNDKIPWWSESIKWDPVFSGIFSGMRQGSLVIAGSGGYSESEFAANPPTNNAETLAIIHQAIRQKIKTIEIKSQMLPCLRPLIEFQKVTKVFEMKFSHPSWGKNPMDTEPSTWDQVCRDLRSI